MKDASKVQKPVVLDDPANIRSVDKSNMLSFCVEANQHYEKGAELGRTLSVDYPKPKAIIVAGMGGSAIGGDLLKDWARGRVTVPIEVCREYKLPKYANKDVLISIISYSGETEESLSAFLDAIERGCMVTCLSSGGNLIEYAEKMSIPCLRVPTGMAPRATLPYLFLPQIILLHKLGLVPNIDSEISEATAILKQIGKENSPDKPVTDNFTKSLASEIGVTVPIVYGFGVYRAVAQRFKTQINENSKTPAKWETFPELDHNEIVGWEAAESLAKFFSVILLRDKEEAGEMKLRIEVTKELLRRAGLRTFEVWSRGRSTLARMSATISIGDFTSVYLAILKGIDPTPVRTIDLLKKRIKQSGLREKIIRELQSFVKR
jgi:glucose/mannose-6-phosphate isomerase